MGPSTYYVTSMGGRGVCKMMTYDDSNVVTFFVKIAEMTMARLTNVYFSLVESQ